MGCDRNLFTLRLVLNQTRGEWQWQAAAQGWGSRASRSLKMERFCHVAQVWHYIPFPGLRVIFKALGIERRMDRWSMQGMYEENKRWLMCQRQGSLSHAPDGMIMKQSREPLWIILPPFCKMHRQSAIKAISKSGRQRGEWFPLT